MLTLQFLRQTEVSQLDVPVLAQQNILRLQVAIYYLLRVQVLDRQDDLRCVKDNFLLCQASFLLQVVEECAPALVVQQKVQASLALERVVQLENEGMVERHENLSLQLDVTEVVLLLQYRLIEHLHSVIGALSRLL